MTNLWKETNYKPQLPYIINQFITEYDISKANINILLYKEIITKELYDELYNAEKKYREIIVGLMERNNPAISDIKAKGIMEFRKIFCESNELEDQDILTIKNDAIYVIGKFPSYTNFHNIVFVKKHTYTLFMLLDKLEVYYLYDPISGCEVIDVKGINDNTLLLHREYMITFLCDVFYKLQNGAPQDAANTCSDFLEKYLRLELDVGFYREFNSRSQYRFDSVTSSFYFDSITREQLKEINTDVNLYIIRNLMGHVYDITRNKLG